MGEQRGGRACRAIRGARPVRSRRARGARQPRARARPAVRSLRGGDRYPGDDRGRCPVGPAGSRRRLPFPRLAAFDPRAGNRAAPTDIARYRRDADRPPDRELVLAMTMVGLPFLTARLLGIDSAWFAPVEWGAAMPAMNWATTGDQIHWVLRDPATGRENMAIDWHFHRGAVIKLRIANERAVLHGMQHPMHLHGQRFLVLAVNGTANDNLAWKDTVVVPAGATVDLLVDLSNPGRWMLHCHIAEHLAGGMMTAITVD